MLLFVVCNNIQDYWRPTVYSTDEVLENYFYMLFKHNAGDWCKMLEIYCLNRASGAANNYQRDLLDLKAQTSKIIKSALGT